MTTGDQTRTPHVSVGLGTAGMAEILSSSEELLSLHPSRMLVGIEWDLLDTVETAGSSFLSHRVRKSTKSKLTTPETFASH